MHTIIPNNTRVIDIARQARAQGQHFITDGKNTLISPVVYPGWFKIGVTIKKEKPCAA